MASKFEIIASIDTDPAEKGLDSLNKAAESAAKNIDKNLESIGDTLDEIGSKSSTINVAPDTKSIQAAERELKQLEKTYEDLAQAAEEARNFMNFATEGGNSVNEFTQPLIDGFEEAAQAADKTAQEIFALEDAITNAKSQMADTQAQKQYSQEQDAAAKATKRLEQEQSQQQRQTELLQAAMVNYITQAVNKAIDSMNQLVESTFSYRQEMGFLEANLAQVGIDLDTATEYMSQFGAVSDNTSQNVAAVANLLQSGFEGQQLSQAIDAVSGAVIAFPDQNVQRIAEGIQRTFGESKAVGNFAELIKRTGGDVEQFNEKMSNATSDMQKQNIIMRELSRQGLSDVLENYKELNPELVAASEAQLELSDNTARLGEALQGGASEVADMKAAFAGWIADIAEANPELTKIAYIIVNVGGALLGAVAAVALIKKTFSDLPSLFGNIGQSASQVGTGTQTMGKGFQEAGQKASQANYQFLSVAAGIAVIAVGISVAILAISELVRAFGGSGSEALQIAAAVGIIVGALTLVIASLIALSKVVGQNSSQFIVYAAAIGVIAGAFSLMLVALTDLVDVMNDSDESFNEIANGISKIILAMTSGIVIISAFGLLAGGMAPQLLIFSVSVLALASAFFVLAAALALLSGRSISIPQVPQAGGRSVGRYANGTASARRGYNWIDETTNPRLLWFNGGEQVITNAQATAQRSAQGGYGDRVQQIYLGGITIDAKNVKEFNDVVRIVHGYADSYKKGYVGG